MSEYALHVSVADLLTRFAAPGVVWWSTNNNGGGRMSIQAAARLKRLGQRPGVPDFIVLSPTLKNPFCALELKSAKGRLSPAQTDFAFAVKCLGCRYEIARSIEEATDWLTEFGAIEAGRITGVKRRDAA